MSVDMTQVQQQPVQSVSGQYTPPVLQTVQGTMVPLAATTAPQTASAVVSQTTQTTATAPDRATAVAAVDNAVTSSGIGQVIGADLAKTPTAVASVVLGLIVLVAVVSVIGFAYLLVQAVSQHSLQAQQYVSAIGDRALTVGAILLGGFGLWVAPSPQVKK